MTRRKRIRNKTIRKPSQYVDWVRIYRLQCLIFTDACIRSFDGKNIVVGQFLSKLMRRIDRIERRIDLEHEVMDKSFTDLLGRIINRMDGELEND